MFSFGCKKPFLLERDCSSWSDGPTRRIEARGVAIKIAGSADGRVVAMTNASSWDAQFPLEGYAAVEEELRAHDVRIRNVTVIASWGITQGYILELDGDGYSVLEALSR